LAFHHSAVGNKAVSRAEGIERFRSLARPFALVFAPSPRSMENLSSQKTSVAKNLLTGFRS
jgi:hypothetical protein